MGNLLIVDLPPVVVEKVPLGIVSYDMIFTGIFDASCHGMVALFVKSDRANVNFAGGLFDTSHCSEAFEKLLGAVDITTHFLEAFDIGF